MPRRSKPKYPSPEDYDFLMDFGRFVIYEFKPAQATHWRNFKIVAEKPVSRRSNWFLGWNGERWASNSNLAHVEENFPQILDLILEKIHA